MEKPAMAAQSFSVRVHASAPVERVFGLLADGARWSQWAGPIVPGSRWGREGDPAPGGIGAVRVLGREPIVTHEEIVQYDPPHRLAYTITAGLPVRDYLGTVNLAADGGGTQITWTASFHPRYPGTGVPLRVMSKLVVTSIAKHLAAEAARRAG